MIHRDDGRLVAECDECGQMEDLEAETFDDAIQEIKGEGWLVQHSQDAGWVHACAACVEVAKQWG